MRRVVVDGERHVGAEDRLEVEGGLHLVEAQETAMLVQGPWVALRMKQRRRGQKSGQA